ncbi:MAG: protein-tyrosine phosphatase [Planctomycetota bacterium]|jgi:protein-tyrosine phosphatase
MFEGLKSLFSSKKKINIESLAAFGVDIHSHLIADIDDGVNTIDEAIEILLKLKSLGYRKVITTPHTMKGGYDNTPEIILSGYDMLKEEMERRNFNFPIEVASEYYLDETFLKLLSDENKILTFGDNYLLFELSYITRPSNMETAFFEMNVAGYRPIMAHPERYPYLIDKDLTAYKKIKDAGIYLQLNLFSLVGYYGKPAQYTAERLIDADMIDFVGTDIHNPSQIDVLTSCLKSEYVEKLLNYKGLKNNLL